jgi:hypothetical protein
MYHGVIVRRCGVRAYPSVCVHAGVFARLSAGVRDRRLVEAITSVMFHNVDHNQLLHVDYIL